MKDLQNRAERLRSSDASAIFGVAHPQRMFHGTFIGS